jgi:putative heme-binding domain-containing protein
VTQHGKSVAEVLEQFREYEWRTRYRARRDLQNRPSTEVLPAVKAWLAKLDPKDPVYDRLRCEALWQQEGHHAVDAELLKQVLQSKTPDARAAAVRIAADQRDEIAGVFDLLRAAAKDEHPRVRTEAVRGLSFYPTVDAAAAVLAALQKPDDSYVKYTVEAALGANENVWRQAYLTGQLTKDDAAKKFIAGILSSSKTGGAAAPYLQTLLGKDPQPAEARNKAMQALADMKGNVGNGKQVFLRNCIACHRVGKEQGQDYGPNLDKVAMRLTKFKIVESIIDPNADVDMKYLTTQIVTADGKTVSGLVVSETADVVVIFDGKEKREIKKKAIEERNVLKQSSMPEGLGATIAPVEFLDLMSYLASLK